MTDGTRIKNYMSNIDDVKVKKRSINSNLEIMNRSANTCASFLSKTPKTLSFKTSTINIRHHSYRGMQC